MTKELRMKNAFYMGDGTWMDSNLIKSDARRVMHNIFGECYYKAVSLNNKMLLALVCALAFAWLALGTQSGEMNGTLFAKPDTSGNHYEFASPHMKSLMRYEMTH